MAKRFIVFRLRGTARKRQNIKKLQVKENTAKIMRYLMSVEVSIMNLFVHTLCYYELIVLYCVMSRYVSMLHMTKPAVCRMHHACSPPAQLPLRSVFVRCECA